jgi:putative N-acetylmannosamine-6-phosphate epimerase
VRRHYKVNVRNQNGIAIAPVIQKLYRRLIVSCQARDGEPFRNPESQARFAISAVNGGAAGIRAQGPDDVRAIRAAVPVPILGIRKIRQDDGKVLITPSFESARELFAAGADMIALDATARGRRLGAFERLRRIQTELKIPVMADIATIDEALEAAAAGADAVLSTMRGYTDDTAHIRTFDREFIRDIARYSPVPVIAEGMIETPDQARAALDAGAYAVIVGSAITRPVTIARRFASALENNDGGAGTQ